MIRLNVDEALDKVTIQYIDRFNFRAKTTEAKLSETQIYIERLEDRYRFFRKRPDHVSVYLTHSNFKSIRIGPQDFETDMEQLAEFLEKIKDVRVQKKQKTTTSTHN